MSTEMSAAVEAVAEALFRWNTPTDPYFVIHGRFGEYADEDCYLPIARAALAAVETECGVRIVPADAIVIERAELPEVTCSAGDSPKIGNTTWCGVTESGMRHDALHFLALAEYLAAHPPMPPVSDEDVETLAGLLWEYAQNPSGPGDTFAETNEGERNRFRNRARRLLATGRVSVTHE